EDPEAVLGVAREELLPAALPDVRVGGHEDAGDRAFAACLPAALGGLDAAVAPELGGRLAEVPDVAVPVLGVPVLGSLLEPPAQEEPVADHGAANAFDRLRLRGDPEDVAGGLTVLDSPVDGCG